MAVQIPFPLPSKGYALNSKLRINLDYIVEQFNQFNTGTATWDQVAIGIANRESGTLTFYNSSNANYLAFQPGATSTSTTFTLPTGVPAANRRFLNSTTGGVMGWSALSDLSSYTGNQLLYADGAGVIQELAVGSGTKLLANSAPPTFITLAGTTNQIVITPTTGTLTLSLPQSINTGANVNFNQVILGGGSATNPAVAVIFSGASNNTGLWSASGTELDMTVAGATRFSLDSTGLGVATGELRAPVIRGTTSLRVSTSTGKIATIQGPAAASADYTLTLPNDTGTNHYVLSTDGAGALSWASVTSVGGATVALDNLSTVAINTSLLPASDNAIDLGSATKDFRTLYVSTSLKNGSTTLATATELGYISGVTSAIQTQIDAKAVKALSNLASVAINTSLLPGTDNSIDLGSASFRWINLYAKTLRAGASGTAGSLTVFPSTATTGRIDLTAAANAGDTITTITNASQAGARTYTIPDAGASARFVMTEGAQTLNGAKTHSADITITGNHSLILNDGEGTPKAVTIQSPATLTGNWTMTLPVSGGTNNYVLTTNGSGTTSWTAAGSLNGTVNSGTAGDFAYYASSTTAVSDQSILTLSSSTITVAAGNLRVTGDDSTNGALDINSSLAGTKLIRLYNSSVNSAANTKLHIQCGGVTTGGDAFIEFTNDTTPDHWAIGIDHSDSDNWKLSQAATLGTTDLIVANITATSVAIHGTNTNNDAATGFVGEYVVSTVGTTSFPTTSQYGDLTSITLSAGDWDITAYWTATANGATVTTTEYGISATTGNSGTGLNGNINDWSGPLVTAATDASGTIANYRVSISGSTTYYLKFRAIFTVATPQARGTLSARRRR